MTRDSFRPPDGTPRRNCGDCTACCTVMGVHDLPERKPPGVTCAHVCSRGCRIYAARPTTCRDFACVWVQGGLPKPFRPDKTGVVFVTNEDGDTLVGHIDSNRPDHWRKVPGFRDFLEGIGRKGAEVWLGITGTGRIDVKFTTAGEVARPADTPPPPPSALTWPE